MPLVATERMIRTRKPSTSCLRKIVYHEQTPNIETLLAMQEVEDMINGKIHKNPQSLDSLFEELGINVNRQLLG